MNRSKIAEEMIRGIEDGLWLSAWADAAERLGRGLPRNINRETADRAPPQVRALAKRFASHLEKLNRASLQDLHRRASVADRRQVSPADPNALGYYLAMQSLGHGVSWEDDHAPFDIRIPSGEVWAERGPRGRWSLEGYVDDVRFDHGMKAQPPRSPAEARAIRAADHAYKTNRPEAFDVAADAAEEARLSVWAMTLNRAARELRGWYTRNIEGLDVTFTWHPKMRVYESGRVVQVGGWSGTIHAKRGPGTLPGGTGATAEKAEAQTRALLQQQSLRARDHQPARPARPARSAPPTRPAQSRRRRVV